MELIEVPDFFYNYRVVTNTGETFNANRNIKHYRGIIKGDTASLVALTFEENEVKGFISNNDGVFNLGLNPIVGKHMLYNSKNSYSAKTFDCGTIDDFSEVYDSAILSQEYRASNVTNSYKYVRLFLETEFDIFQERESISRVESLITSIFNQVAAIYQNEGILISLSELFVWTTDDPYTGNTTDALLTQYQNRKTSIKW